MIDARHRWVFPEPLRLDPEVRAAARALGLGTFAATVLARRRHRRPGGHGALPRRRPRTASTTRTCSPTRTASSSASAARVTAGERVMVFGDFDADGLTGLAQLVLAFRRLGLDAVPYVPSPARGGPRPLDGRGRDGGARRRRADRDRRHRVDERRRDRRWPRPRDRRDHHRPPPPARGPPRGGRHRQPAARGLRLPGPGPVGSRAWRSRSRGCSSASCLDAEAEARDLADLATIGTVSDVAPIARREPGHRAARAGADAARRRGRGSRRCSSGRARATPRSTSRPSASCSRRG